MILSIADPVESTEIVKRNKKEKEQIQKLTDDVSKKYDYTRRGNLYSLIEKGQEAIKNLLWKLQVKLQVQEHMKLLDN